MQVQVAVVGGQTLLESMHFGQVSRLEDGEEVFPDLAMTLHHLLPFEWNILLQLLNSQFHQSPLISLGGYSPL